MSCDACKRAPNDGKTCNFCGKTAPHQDALIIAAAIESADTYERSRLRAEVDRLTQRLGEVEGWCDGWKDAHEMAADQRDKALAEASRLRGELAEARRERNAAELRAAEEHAAIEVMAQDHQHEADALHELHRQAVTARDAAETRLAEARGLLKELVGDRDEVPLAQAAYVVEMGARNSDIIQRRDDLRAFAEQLRAIEQRAVAFLAVGESQSETDRLRAALTAISEYETDWTVGPAENVNRLQAIAERALAGEIQPGEPGKVDR